jgi:hypothetical protein
MSKEQFARSFPELDNEVVLKNLVAVFSRYSSVDDLIHFEEFAGLLSIMTRGSIEDKIECMLYLRFCWRFYSTFVAHDYRISNVANYLLF